MPIIICNNFHRQFTSCLQICSQGKKLWSENVKPVNLMSPFVRWRLRFSTTEGFCSSNCLSWCRKAFDLFCSTRKTTGISVWWIWHTVKGVDGNLKGLKCLSLSLAWTANVSYDLGTSVRGPPWNYKQVCRVTGSFILEAVAGIKTTILKHRQPHGVQQSEQQQKKKNSVMWSDTPMVWEWTSMEVLTGPIKTLGLVECQLHASKSRQPQKSCCLICVPLSPWQSETDNEEAPLLLLFCQKELEQSKRKAERRRWRCGELSQRHTHKHTRTQNCEFVIQSLFFWKVLICSLDQYH